MLCIFVFFTCLTLVVVSVKENDLNDVISTPDTLFLAWKFYTETHRNQTARFGQEFPVDERLYSSLRHCGLDYATSAPSTHTVSLSEISIYSEIGHQSTFCRPGINLVQHPNDTLKLEAAADTFRRSCLNSMQTQSNLPSLAKILKRMGADLEVFESNLPHQNLQTWTKHVIRMITRVEDFNKRWKLLLIAPGLFDLKIGADIQTLNDDILQSLQVIKDKLPTKTFVLILKNTQFTISHDVERTFIFCEKMLSLYNANNAHVAASWQTLESRVKQNYQTEEFFVNIIDILDGSISLIFDRTPDISILDVDCVHFSERGLSLLHTHIYNYIIQPVRQTIFRPTVRPLVCPRPECPYIVTPTNKQFCPKPKQMEIIDTLKSRTIFGLLFGCIVSLYLILFIYSVCL
ncbi:hypothetical protein M3Y97_00085800 [Aphelenchoides bicaudatus]|nr:hypothetical protein M3Y97_00085800 [Aphelenchoides bicaudatus]